MLSNQQLLKRIQWVESVRPHITHMQYILLHSRICQDASLEQLAEEFLCSEENIRQILQRLRLNLYSLAQIEFQE